MKKILVQLSTLLALAAPPQAQSDVLSTAVQQGLFEEEVNRNFPAAIESYEAAIAEFEQTRPLAATALFRLAEVYRHMDRTEEAEGLYKRVVREFHDQADLAARAAEQLPEGTRLATGPGIVDKEAEEIERLKKLVRDSPDLLDSRDDDGNTRLHNAIQQGQLRVAEFLIEQGLDLATVNRRGFMPLHLAAYEGRKSAVELLLRHGANVMSRMATRSYKNGWTPLHCAADRGHFFAAKVILNQGADPNAKSSEGDTVLHRAIGEDIEFILLLLQHGAEVNMFNSRGRTPLDYALARAKEPTEPKAARIVELLRQNGAVEGRFYVFIWTTDDEQPLVVHWDKSERMTLTKALEEAGLSAGKFDKAFIEGTEERGLPPQVLHMLLKLPGSLDYRRTIMVEIPPILKDQAEDPEIHDGFEVVVSSDSESEN